MCTQQHIFFVSFRDGGSERVAFQAPFFWPRRSRWSAPPGYLRVKRWFICYHLPTLYLIEFIIWMCSAYFVYLEWLFEKNSTDAHAHRGCWCKLPRNLHRRFATMQSVKLICLKCEKCESVRRSRCAWNDIIEIHWNVYFNYSLYSYEINCHRLSVLIQREWFFVFFFCFSSLTILNADSFPVTQLFLLFKLTFSLWRNSIELMTVSSLL